MVKFNESVSFHSAGFSLGKMLRPFLIFAFLVFSAFMYLETTKFAYANIYADAILSKKQYSNKDLFIKYHDKIVYIKSLNPVLKEAEGVKVFYIKNNKLSKFISADKAVFNGEYWKMKNAKTVKITKTGIFTEYKNVSVLKDFKPKIISNLKNISSISLYDAVLAVKLFKDVNVNTLLSIVFFKIFTPLCMIALIAVLFIKAPVHQRVSNLSLFMIKSLLLTILLWGVHLMIYKFAKQGVLNPYVLILPSLGMFLYALVLYYKEK